MASAPNRGGGPGMEVNPVRAHQNGTSPAQLRAYNELFYEHGRWYGGCCGAKYLIPIDETELDRMDILHKFFVVALKNNLFTAPIQNQETPHILDIGCGTAIWGIDVADRYPAGHHLGVDLFYIQPEFIPPSIRFMQKDIEAPWENMQPGAWDLIHMRGLNGSIVNWPKLYAEIYRHLKPWYGYIEQVEIDWTPRSDDGSLPPDAKIIRWAKELGDVMDTLERPIRVDGNLTKQRLADAGFVDIKEEVIMAPVSSWPTDMNHREAGRWFGVALTSTFASLSLAPLLRGGRTNKTAAEINEFAAQIKDEIKARGIHAYCTLHVFTARRPQLTNTEPTLQAGRPSRQLGSRQSFSLSGLVQRISSALGLRRGFLGSPLTRS